MNKCVYPLNWYNKENINNYILKYIRKNKSTITNPNNAFFFQSLYNQIQAIP